MITERDLDEAIAECQGTRKPDANTCIKLAAFYTIRRELFRKPETEQYSYAPPPDNPETVTIDSGSEFARAINGRKQAEIWPIMEELMETVYTIEPRLYRAVMDKLT